MKSLIIPQRSTTLRRSLTNFFLPAYLHTYLLGAYLLPKALSKFPKRPKNLHQFGVRFTKKPMNFISAMSGSDGNSVMERAAIGKFGMSWHSTGPLKQIAAVKENIDGSKKRIEIEYCIVLLHIMAFPVVEFSREGYKIRKVFG